MAAAELEDKITAEIDKQERALAKDQFKYHLQAIISLIGALSDKDFQQALEECFMAGWEPDRCDHADDIMRVRSDGKLCDHVTGLKRVKSEGKLKDRVARSTNSRYEWLWSKKPLIMIRGEDRKDIRG